MVASMDYSLEHNANLDSGELEPGAETVLGLYPTCREISSWVIVSMRDLLADTMPQLSTVIRKLQNKQQQQQNLENIWCLLSLHGLQFIIYWQ